MNKQIVFLIVMLLCLFISELNAKIWSVDNNPNPAGDFTTLAVAQSAASSGDTIYVYPSAASYTGITVTKRLYFFGVGFNLNIYSGQASNASSTIGNMVFNIGSEGSILVGFDGDFLVDINTSNITVKKCDLLKVDIAGSSCTIMQNEIVSSQYFSACVLISQPNLSDILIVNNKIHNTYYLGSYWAINGNNLSDVYIINNVINAGDAIGVVSTNSLVQNNIIIRGGCNTSPVYQHNMSNSDQLPQENGNIINIDMSTVFDDPNNFTSGLHLKEYSPAIGTGFNGNDMGIYGGNHPYVDGGLPSLPSIFYLESEATTSQQQGLNVVIKAKSNKR